MDGDTPVEAEARDEVAESAADVAQAAAAVVMAQSLEGDKWTAIIARLDRIEAKQDEAALATAIAEAEPAAEAETVSEPAEPIAVAAPTPPAPTRHSRKRVLSFGSKRR